MMRFLAIFYISAICALPTMAASKTTLELKCIGTASSNPHTGDLTITYEEDPDGITGEMVYEGQKIEDGKLNETNFSAKLIGNGGNSIIAQTQPIGGGVGFLFFNHIIEFDTGHFYSYMIRLDGEEATIMPSKDMTCAIKK